ncbi:MAG: hypothetical protein JXA10_01995 [Anaerolineae bacterium]|nr:hypothetical protein [Anaerolineae bacterium]
MLFLKTFENTRDASVWLGFTAGLILAGALWLAMGGRYLLQNSRKTVPA